MVQPYVSAEGWDSDKVYAHYKKHKHTLGHESDVLRVDQLCNVLPNICDNGYSLPGDTRVTLLLSLPKGNASSIVFSDNYFVLNVSKLRFELSNYKTGELYQDFTIGDLVYNQTLYTDDRTGKFATEDSWHVEFSETAFETKTAYFHNEPELWKMASKVESMFHRW